MFKKIRKNKKSFHFKSHKFKVKTFLHLKKLCNVASFTFEKASEDPKKSSFETTVIARKVLVAGKSAACHNIINLVFSP